MAIRNNECRSMLVTFISFPFLIFSFFYLNNSIEPTFFKGLLGFDFVL